MGNLIQAQQDCQKAMEHLKKRMKTAGTIVGDMHKKKCQKLLENAAK